MGRALLEWLMAEARAAGYREIVGDTMPAMRFALALYERMGFECTRSAPEPHASLPSDSPILIRIKL